MPETYETLRPLCGFSPYQREQITNAMHKAGGYSLNAELWAINCAGTRTTYEIRLPNGTRVPFAFSRCELCGA